ncbi:hypothetical protein LOD99_11900 [Oopsacas minuta]|uniref:Tc1-like transposase DDE domain-containing protein n=1 Tax=Oopsacas minuta TaxID=111878 RepID=A0AAV7JGZ2_9METZ|nr:hypothetical protein LOD99_11900 [Oopsacas minuta]
MERERSAIVELFTKGHPSREILKILKLPLNRRKFVYRTIRRYKDTGKVEDRARSGRPCSVTTPSLGKVIAQRIRRNPRRSIRKMALDLKVSRCAMTKIVKRDLGMSSFKRKKVHFLSQLVKEKRVARCKGALGRYAVENLEKILFSDEKIFTIQEATNVQNDRILASSPSKVDEKFRYVSRIQNPKSVMVWAGVSKMGRTPLVFVPQGVKINSINYREMVLEPVLKNIGRDMFGGTSFVFQQDGAPAHTSNVTQSWLHDNFPGFITKEEWPPYSPDLNPMDYSVWSILETKACVNSHTSIKSLKRKLCQEWNKIPQKTLRAAIEALPDRITRVIQNEGGYIE